jgi:hypothetical protein
VLKWSGHATLEPAAFAAATAATVPAASAPLGLTISASWAAGTEAEGYQENECIRVVQYYLKKGLRVLMNSHERKGL